MMEILGQQLKELKDMDDKEYLYKTMLQMVSIIGVICLAVAGLVIDGSVGESIAVSVAGFLGVIIGYVFPKSSTCDVSEGEKA